MSKRKNRNKSGAPNLPQETLERARREAGLEVDDTPEDEAEAVADEVIDEIEPVLPRRRSAMDAPPRPAASRRRRKEVAYEEMTHEEIMERLANPTKVVTEAELQRDYQYVIADLRSMALLAAALFIALIVVAQVFVV